MGKMGFGSECCVSFGFGLELIVLCVRGEPSQKHHYRRRQDIPTERKCPHPSSCSITTILFTLYLSVLTLLSVQPFQALRIFM